MGTQDAAPAPRRSAVKRRAILDAAISLFLAQGYARTSVDAIAAAAGVGKQTVYGHFGDKEALFLAAVDAARGAAHTPLPDELADTGDPVADLTDAGERLLRVVLSRELSELHRLTIAELPHHPELQRMWRDGSGILPDTVADYLRACHRAGTLDVPEPEQAARQFTVLVTAEGRVATLQGTQPLDPDVGHAIARHSAELIVRAHRPLD